jgi:hypothetical protein
MRFRNWQAQLPAQGYRMMRRESLKDQMEVLEFMMSIEVPPGRLELPAQGLGIPCSIRLSYGGTICFQEVGRAVAHRHGCWCPYRCSSGRWLDAAPLGRSYCTP